MNYDEMLYPEGGEIIQAAIERHPGALAYACEAVALAHLAFRAKRDYESQFVPGVPCIRKVRTEINDDAWRYMRMLGEPLVSAGLIREFTSVEGGDMMVLNDGMHVRMKKGTPAGNTSNHTSGRTIQMERSAQDACLFSGASPLDVAIRDGVVFDVVFVAGRAMGDYLHVGLKMAALDYSPFLVVDPPSAEQLRAVSPQAFDLLTDARQKFGA